MIHLLLLGIAFSPFIASSFGNNACESNPCSPSGVCVSLPNGHYRCNCRIPYIGKHCNLRDKDCFKNCFFDDSGPVCGSDGYTYWSMCELNEAVCQVEKRKNDSTVHEDRRNITFVKKERCEASEKCCAGDCYAYRGKEYRTKSGQICQRWDSQTPNKHSYTRERFPHAGLEENYCRNPSGAGRSWCYLAKKQKSGRRWEYCDVPLCKRNVFKDDCCRKRDCTDFRGKYATTESGRTCKAWTETQYHPDKYPQHGLEANYCRNPSGHRGAWCYTTDPKKRWENCGVLFCFLRPNPAMTISEEHKESMGKRW